MTFFEKLPKQRRVGLFSATLDIRKPDLLFLGMRNCQKIKLTVTLHNDVVDIIIPDTLNNDVQVVDN